MLAGRSPAFCRLLRNGEKEPTARSASTLIEKPLLLKLAGGSRRVRCSAGEKVAERIEHIIGKPVRTSASPVLPQQFNTCSNGICTDLGIDLPQALKKVGIGNGVVIEKHYYFARCREQASVARIGQPASRLGETMHVPYIVGLLPFMPARVRVDPHRAQRPVTRAIVNDDNLKGSKRQCLPPQAGQGIQNESAAVISTQNNAELHRFRNGNG